MTTFEHSVDVNVPVNTAYNQWTQFEKFPAFMDGVESITQLTDSTMRWRAEIAGNMQEWDAKIVEQIPDQRISWTSTSGATHAGAVTFHYIDDNITRIMLQIDYNPEGFIENVGTALGVVETRMRGDLSRFKEFIEDRGAETGAWRGEIKHEEKDYR